MAEPKFTTEQQAAIDAAGKTIVSASAGSGKTTVMIEKMLGLIRSGVDVSEILAVTYTKKAAAQMKEKLRKKILKALAEPNLKREEREWLKKQLLGVPGADVSTIHSFCSKLIKTHFYAADVGNNFSIISAEDADGKVLQGRALDELFEDGYERKDPDFYKLLSVYYRKKNDDNLRFILTSTYNALRSRDDYIEFLEKTKTLDEGAFDRVCEQLKEEYLQRLRAIEPKVREAKEYFKAQQALADADYERQSNERIAAGKKPLKRKEKKGSLPLAKEVTEYLLQAFEAKDLFALCALSPVFSKKESGSFAPDYEARVESLAFAVSEIKKVAERCKKVGTREEELTAFLNAAEISRALAKYLLLFDKGYEEQKRDRGVLDYNDLEHISLGLLAKEDVREEMRKKYRYVFVDEYQDVNPVQEKLIRLISGDNVFLVGDMKQAIYAFRGSKSIYFKNTWEEYKTDEGCNALQLPHNFRSRLPILKAVNDQFAQSMTEEFCGIDYEAEGKMKESPVYETPEGYEGFVQVHMLAKKNPSKKKADEETEGNTGESEETPRGVYSVRENAGKKAEKEDSTIRSVVRIVKEARGKEFYDSEEKRVREVEYSDIAILTRWNFGRTSLLTAALAEEGVPVVSESPVNIFDFSEIQLLTDILRIIDNAEQDIPLCSVLLSSVGGLTENELAKIRLAYPSTKGYEFFRSACKAYAKEKTDGISAKLKKFFAYLQEVRRLAQLVPAGEILIKILSETGLEARLLACFGGETCLRRIYRFLDEARGEEPLSVHEFLLRLKQLSYKIIYTENGGENSVRIMTMHASKGLEFPIVIVDDLNKPFHKIDSDPVMVEEEFGLAPKAHDSEKMVTRTTLLRSLCEARKLGERAKDELNLYYVALTRAKYGLHLIFDNKKTNYNLHYASSVAEFTNFALWTDLQKYDADEEPTVLERQVIAVETDEDLKSRIERALAWKYGHSGCENLPVKSSATALLKQKSPFEKENVTTVFAVDEEERTGVLEGLAYHAFLEHCSFAFDGVEGLEPWIENELERMKTTGLLSEEYLGVLRIEKLKEILSLPVFSRLEGKTLYRERKFLAAIPACEVLALLGEEVAEGECGEELVFQGALDLMAEGDTEIEIIDYKYSKKNAEGLYRHYLPQLTLYKKAVARILKVDEEKIRCTIVNIFQGFEVNMDGAGTC